ncbi:MAG TPA: hypothetical protein VFG69_15750 [Nannocystaceae bacterium]|nr:hypothetical protein [Nannocystaceae bacterium]
MLLSDTDVDDALVRPEIGRRKRVAHLARFVASVLSVTEPQLAVAVPTPTLQPPVLERCARRTLEGVDLYDARFGTEIDERKIVTHLAGSVTAVVGVAEAKTPATVEAPALQPTVCERRARRVRRRQHSDFRCIAEVDERERFDAGRRRIELTSRHDVTVAVHAVFVVRPPTLQSAVEERTAGHSGDDSADIGSKAYRR